MKRLMFAALNATAMAAGVTLGGWVVSLVFNDSFGALDVFHAAFVVALLYEWER